MPESIVGDWQAIAQTEPFVENELVEDKQVRDDNFPDGWEEEIRLPGWYQRKNKFYIFFNT